MLPCVVHVHSGSDVVSLLRQQVEEAKRENNKLKREKERQEERDTNRRYFIPNLTQVSCVLLTCFACPVQF